MSDLRKAAEMALDTLEIGDSAQRAEAIIALSDALKANEQKYPTEADLKAMAYAMKVKNNMKIGHCYETIAKQYGFNTYASMRQAMKDTK